MDYAVLTGLVLVTGVALALLAEWKGWRPAPVVIMALGIGFRVLIMVLSARDSWQPPDFLNSFKPAGEAIVHHRDPVLESNGGWHFLPTIPYVYGLLLWLHIPWEVAGRLVTVVCDIVLIPLVGAMAGGDKARLRAFQYACNPLAILVACVHGQVEPVSLVFGVAAFVVAAKAGTRTSEGAEGAEGGERAERAERAEGAGAVAPGLMRRAIVAGLLMGLALCAKSWPIWLIPGMLLLLPGVRARIAAFIATGVAPLFFLVTLPIGAGTSLAQLPQVIKTIGGVRPIVGEWGWTAISVHGNWTLDADLARFGQWAIYAAVLAVIVVWRRGHPVDLTTAILLAFMVVTPRLGAQYLMWFMPFLVARPTRFAWPAILGCSAWAGAGYLYLTQFSVDEWWRLHSIWAQCSIVLLPILLAAMPWERIRGARTPTGALPTSPSPPSRGIAAAK